MPQCHTQSHLPKHKAPPIIISTHTLFLSQIWPPPSSFHHRLPLSLSLTMATTLTSLFLLSLSLSKKFLLLSNSDTQNLLCHWSPPPSLWSPSSKRLWSTTLTPQWFKKSRLEGWWLGIFVDVGLNRWFLKWAWTLLWSYGLGVWKMMVREFCEDCLWAWRSSIEGRIVSFELVTNKNGFERERSKCGSYCQEQSQQ